MCRFRLGLAALIAISSVYAAPVMTVSSDATLLADTLRGANPFTITSAVLTSDGAEAGTFTDADGSPIFFNNGVFLTSGVASCVPGPNSLEDCTGEGTFTQLLVHFTPSAGASSIGFNFRFGSEEFHEYVGDIFQDHFFFEVNGVNYAKLHNGSIVTIDSVAASADYIRNDGAFGPIDHRTELDGFTTILQFVAPVNPLQDNTLRLYISDVSDDILDSAVFIESGTLQENPPVPGIPEPATWSLLAGSLGVLALRKYRRG